MKVYKSRSSVLVRIITIGFTITLLAIAATLTLTLEDQGYVIGGGIAILMLLILVYYYGRSVKQIELDDHSLVIRQNMNKIRIPYSEIKKIEILEFSNLVMGGSKGFFGFIGPAMDDSYSFVNDRKKMIKIFTDKENYLLSCDDREGLRDEINHKGG